MNGKSWWYTVICNTRHLCHRLK